MKATIRKLIVPFFTLGFCLYAARAEVTSYTVFKTALFHQTDATQPTMVDSPNAYFFGAQVFAETNYEIISDAEVTTPNSVTYPLTGNPAPTYFSYNSDYYPDKTSIDTNFPSGAYEFDVNTNSDSGELDYPVEELYSPVIPYFTGDTWSHLQAVDPSRPLTLCWNSFTPNPDATSAYVFINILDPSFNYVYTANFLEYDLTNYCVPANTLEAGVTYRLQILFSSRADDVDLGFSSDAPATAGFDVLTYTSLITDAPVLSIAPGANAVVISWPISASNYSLESTLKLYPAPLAWSPVTNSVAVTNNQNVVVVPTGSQAKLFQLYQTSN